MKKTWTQGLDATQEEDIRGSYTAAFLLRKRLITLLQEKQDASSSSLYSKTLYDSPNWAFLQADARGYERAISDIIFLLK